MKKEGFTLLEILISISVIGIVSTLIAQVFFTTTRVNTKTELMKDVKQTGDVAIDVMARMIRNSYGVTSVCDGTDVHTLSIKNPDGDTTTFGCQAWTDAVTHESSMRIASVSAQTGTVSYLSSANVTLGGTTCADVLSTLRFTCNQISTTTQDIVISFQLAQRGAGVQQFEKASMPFQTTVSPRN